jgi:hypothetical protein
VLGGGEGEVFAALAQEVDVAAGQRDLDGRRRVGGPLPADGVQDIEDIAEETASAR